MFAVINSCSKTTHNVTFSDCGIADFNLRLMYSVVSMIDCFALDGFLIVVIFFLLWWVVPRVL